MIRSFVFRTVTSACVLAAMATSQGMIVKASDKDKDAVRASIEAAIKLLQSDDLSAEDRAKAVKKLEWAQKQLAETPTPVAVRNLEAGQYRIAREQALKAREQIAVVKEQAAKAAAEQQEAAVEQKHARVMLERAMAEKAVAEESAKRAKVAADQAVEVQRKALVDLQNKVKADVEAAMAKRHADDAQAKASVERARVRVYESAKAADEAVPGSAPKIRYEEVRGEELPKHVREIQDPRGHVYELVTPRVVASAGGGGDEEILWVRRRAAEGQNTAPAPQAGQWRVVKGKSTAAADDDDADDAAIRATIDDIRKELKDVRAMMQEIQKRLHDEADEPKAAPSRRAMGFGGSSANTGTARGFAPSTGAATAARAPRAFRSLGGLSATAPMAPMAAVPTVTVAEGIALVPPAPAAPAAPSAPGALSPESAPAAPSAPVAIPVEGFEVSAPAAPAAPAAPRRSRTIRSRDIH